MSVAPFVFLAVATTIPGVEPLAESGADHEQVLAALVALAQGDVRPLSTLPRRLWDEPPAIPDPQDPDLGRRWTLVVAQAHHRGQDPPLPLAPPLTAAQAWDRPWAVGGMDLLRQAGWRAWDHGQSEEATLLFSMTSSAPVLPPAETRGEIGSGRWMSGTRQGPRPGIVATRHWLLGLDPWDRVRWQRRLDEGSRVAVSPGAAVILGPAGFWLVDRQGHQMPLPPAPQDAKPEAATAEGAWFTTASGRQRWWLPVGRRPTALPTPERTLGPPLVSGTVSLWLDETSTLRFEGPRLTDRVDHGIPLTAQARLVGNLGDPWVMDGLGGAWRLDGPPTIDLPRRPLAPTPTDPRHPFEASRPGPTWPRKEPDGSWHLGAQRLQLQRTPGRLGVVSRDGDATWETFWMAAPTDEAPGTTLLIRGDRVIVQEGMQRFTVLDRLGGRRLATIDLPGAVPERITVDDGGAVAWWQGPELQVSPAGSGTPTTFRLSDPLEVVGIRDGFLALTAEKSFWIRPGHPPESISTPSWPSTPHALPGGVGYGDSWWPWRSHLLGP